MAMRLPLPTKPELEKFAKQEKARRKATAERLLQDRVMTREALIEHGIVSERDLN